MTHIGHRYFPETTAGTFLCLKTRGQNYRAILLQNTSKIDAGVNCPHQNNMECQTWWGLVKVLLKKNPDFKHWVCSSTNASQKIC